MSFSSLSRRTLIAAGAALLAAATVVAQPAAAARPPETPSRGDVVPVFETMTVDGSAQKVDFPKGSKTVLLFFLSGCPHCHKMIPEWNQAFERRPKGLRVLGVIMDQEPPGFWQQMPVAFPVLRAPGRDFLRSLNVNRVPLTLRVAEGGRIEDFGLGEVCSGGAAANCIDAIHLGQLFAPPK